MGVKIVYGSHYGTTERYAQELSRRVGIPAMDYRRMGEISSQDTVIYLGGLYAGLTGVRRFGGGGAGLAAIGLYVGENPMNVINALISAAIAFVATFAILWFIGFDDVPEEA